MTIDYYKPIGKLIISLEVNRTKWEHFYFGLFWGVPHSNKKIFGFGLRKKIKVI